ncbi:LysR family transcriptional regulator [Lactobacillus curvatus]|uniref:LysR family transcriptional regulator n=1 Tax=Latilactobacillus fragifolii TaxID=2814244 RepID=UPI0012B0DB47|nr:LysR family transcriptional regulator [Latilactobacillus fragifolii]MSD83407.1 LysR family transcriptional regulator [Latilactobacillus curvatus]MSE23598.1 LysR family transcriptional regulator [Latilactobacillus curvatus]
MEIRLLRYFWTVANAESVSNAAKQLHVTQPTLSRQIRELEDYLGTPLFSRTHHKLVLTEAGLFLKSRAEEILALDQATEQVFIDQKQQLFNGNLRIGCIEADNSDTMATILAELVHDYPNITYAIITGNGDFITDQLDKGLIDVAILIEPINTAKYFSIQLPRGEKWGLLVAKTASLASKSTITPSDFTELPLILPNRPAVMRMLADWYGQAQETLNITGSYNLHYNILPLVELQTTNALVIEGVTKYRDNDKSTFIPLEPSIQTHCRLVWRKDRVLTAVASEYIRRFKKAFA